jgi:hypothetical protein
MTEALSEIVCTNDILDIKEARHRLDQDARMTATQTKLRGQPSYADRARRIKLRGLSYADQATRTKLHGPSYAN